MIVFELKLGSKWRYEVTGIKHVDYQQQPSELIFKNGGIGSNRIEITVNSKPGNGVWSVIHFYGRKLDYSDFFKH